MSRRVCELCAFVDWRAIRVDQMQRWICDDNRYMIVGVMMTMAMMIADDVTPTIYHK